MFSADFIEPHSVPFHITWINERWTFLVIERREGKKLIIEAKVSESNRFNRLFNPGHKNGACPLCALGLDVKHTVCTTCIKL